MDESEQERMLNSLKNKMEYIQGKVDVIRLELRTAAIFLVVLICVLQQMPIYISLLSAFVVSGIYAFFGWSRL